MGSVSLPASTISVFSWFFFFSSIILALAHQLSKTSASLASLSSMEDESCSWDLTSDLTSPVAPLVVHVQAHIIVSPDDESSEGQRLARLKVARSREPLLAQNGYELDGLTRTEGVELALKKSKVR